MKKIINIGASLIWAMSCLAVTVDTQKEVQVITDLEEFARSWAHAAVNELNQEELELLGTFLYYDVAASHYEGATRSALLDLQRGSQILSFKLVNLTDPQESLTMCAQLAALLNTIEKELTPSRNYFLAAWQLCNKEIAHSSHQNLAVVIEQLQLLGRNSLNYWAREKKSEIENLLEKNNHKIQESVEQLTTCKNVLRDIIDGSYPLSNPDCDCMEIETVHNSLTVASAVYELLFKTSLATDEITALSFNLIHINSQLFSILYQAFYNALEEKKLTPMHIVINEHGFIPAESRNAVLPSLVNKSGKPA